MNGNNEVVELLREMLSELRGIREALESGDYEDDEFSDDEEEEEEV